MATRLNKRFIFIISAIIFVLAIGVGGVAYVVISGDAERQVRLGKIAEEKGDLKDALSRYGRAIGKDPRNLEYYDLFENVLFKVVPETRVEAVERYNRQYIGLLERRRGASVDSPDSWLRLLDVYRDRAMVFNSRNQSDMWGDVQEHTQRMVDQFDYDSDGVGREANLAARGMRLHAMSMRPELLKPDEEQIFKSDSVELMNAGSKDPLVWESVLRMSLSRAESHASRGDDRLLMRELADEENGFDTVRARMQEVEIQDTPEITTLLYERAVLNPEDVAEAQREAIHNLVYAETERVAGEILESDSGDQKEALRKKLHQLTLTNILTTDDAVTLLTPLLERNQLPLEMNMMICQNFVMSNPAFARLSAEKTLQLEPLSVSLQAMFQKEARGEAVLALFDAAYLDRAREQSDKEDPESMEGVTVTIEDLYAFKELALREFEGESDYEAVKLYLSGSIALATDDAATARSQFMEMSKTEFAKRPDMRFRYIPRLIASAVLSGERGAALAQLQSFVGQLAPGQGVNLRLRIASEMIRLGRLQDAKVELQKIIASDPKNEDAHSILNDLNVVIEQVQSAPGGTATEGDRRFGRIRSAVTEGRLEDARELLLSAIRVSDDPAFKRYLVLVNIQLGRDEEAREIASTVENWENDEALQRILSRIEVPDPIERIRMLSEISYEDPASRIAVEFTALQRLANSDLPGNEEARKLLPGVFERVLANMTSDAKLHQTLVAATIIEDERSGRENTPEAMSLRVIEVITENETDEVQLANLRAVVVSAQKGPVAGMSILQPVIDRGIANAESWFIMGLGYRQLGRLKEATECLSRAVERSPDNPQYVTWLALSLEQGGEPLKALVVLRQSQLSESTRTALQEAWLMVEADFGEKRVALAHRHEVFNVDMDEANSSDQVIIRVGNALHYARLLLIVKPEREDLLDRNEQPVYSPVAWTRMSGATRRSMIALERENRRERAFEVLELVMEASRSPESRLSAMIAKAEAFQIIGDSESAMGVVAEVLECCGDSLSVPQRLSLIDLLVEIGAEKEVNLQFEALAREEDPSDLRRSIAVALGTGRSDHAVHIATKLFDKTGLPSDRTQLIRAQLSKNMLEEAGIAIAELDADEEVRNSDVLRYETLILDSNLEGLRGLAILRESEIDTRELARVTREKDTAAMDTLLMQIESKKSSAIEYLDNSIRLSDEAIELNKRSPLPLIHKHNMLRTKVLLVDDASAEEDLLSNARLAREIAPMEWRTNRAVVQGYAVIGETKEALAALDQYFRRGGLHDEARETITPYRVDGRQARSRDPVAQGCDVTRSIQPGVAASNCTSLDGSERYRQCFRDVVEGARA